MIFTSGSDRSRRAMTANRETANADGRLECRSASLNFVKMIVGKRGIQPPTREPLFLPSGELRSAGNRPPPCVLLVKLHSSNTVAFSSRPLLAGTLPLVAEKFVQNRRHTVGAQHFPQ